MACIQRAIPTTGARWNYVTLNGTMMSIKPLLARRTEGLGPKQKEALMRGDLRALSMEALA